MTREAGRREAFLGACFAFVVVAIGCSIVLANVRFLPMLDAPNHIATGTIAEGLLAGDPFFRQHYVLYPSPVPYWTTTLGILALKPWLDPTGAFAAIVVLYVLAMPVAFMLLARVAAPENLVLAPLAALGAFGATYWMGESNFLLAQPLFLVSFALYLRIGKLASWTFAAFIAGLVLTYLSHIYGIVALVVSIGALIAVSLPRRSPWLAYRPRPAQWAAAAAVVLTLCLGAAVVFFQGGSATNRGHLVFEWPAPWRFGAIAYDAFSSPLDSSITLARLIMVVLFAWHVLPRLATPRGFSRPAITAAIANPVVPGAAVLLALATLGPLALMSAGRFVEVFRERFSPLAFLVLLLAIRLPRGRLACLVSLAALVPLCGWRLEQVSQLHQLHYARAADLVHELIDPIPEQSRVLGLWRASEMKRPPWDDRFRHLVDYVVVRRHSYSSGVFAAPGQQALRHRLRGSHVPDWQRGLSESDWKSFDFVLLYSRGMPIVEHDLETRARLVAATGDLRLYRLLASAHADP